MHYHHTAIPRVYVLTFVLQVSPPHYPCDPYVSGVSQEIIPGVFWANAVPDADATAHFTVDGESLKFEGLGYHDKNWGIVPLREGVAMKTWYWGHGRVGPYSIVWFDTLTNDGLEHFSSWITKDGEIFVQSCEQDSIVVRPWGENSEYPPPRGSGVPGGYSLRYDLGADGIFVANFTSEALNFGSPVYGRYVGSIVGGMEGGEQFEGKALCEQFQY